MTKETVVFENEDTEETQDEKMIRLLHEWEALLR
jgi:hypothetical protein